MKIQSSARLFMSAFTAAAILTASQAAFAAGPFDGKWVVDFPASGFIEATGGQVCPALRLPIDIKDGHVFASLTRMPSVNGIMIETEDGPQSTPVTGTVQPDGAVQANWQSYDVTGKLDGDSGKVSVRGECGLRTGQAIRITQ
jgi:hypothetical protein